MAFSIVHTTVVNNTNAGTLTATVTLGAASTIGDLIFGGVYYGGGTATAISDNFGTVYLLENSTIGQVGVFGFMAGSGTATVTITGTTTANTTFCMVFAEYTAGGNIGVIATNPNFNQTVKTSPFQLVFDSFNPLVGVGLIDCFTVCNTSTATTYTISATVGSSAVRGTAHQGAISIAVMDVINNTNTAGGTAPFNYTDLRAVGTASGGTNTATQAWTNLAFIQYAVPPGFIDSGFDVGFVG